MLYKYNKDTLLFDDITKTVLLYFFGGLILLTITASVIILNRVNDIRYISEETKTLIIKENDTERAFTPEKLKAYLLELNLRFPHIVYAQAQLETGEFKSNIFKTNNNLFGMKEATSRPTTNKGTENGHAYYEDWRQSVVDYAFFSATYLSNIKTEDEYFQYLGANYAEDPKYVEKLKEKIRENLLKMSKK